MKVYLVGNATQYHNAIKGAVPVEDMKDADVVLFTGGADISPEIYDEEAHPRTGTYPERDVFEMAEWEAAQALGKFCYGICRGSQFLCGMAGGKIVQHITGHAIGGTHGIIVDGEIFQGSSTHHQMMYPYPVEHEMIGVSAEKRSQCYWANPKNQYDMDEEVEIVYFPKTKSLCVQAHPEYMVNTPFWEKTNELITKYFNLANGKGVNTQMHTA